MTTTQTTSRLTVTNPLADEDGETIKVSSALDFISWAIDNGADENGNLALTSDQVFGLFMILNTCSAALKEMA